MKLGHAKPLPSLVVLGMPPYAKHLIIHISQVWEHQVLTTKTDVRLLTLSTNHKIWKLWQLFILVFFVLYFFGFLFTEIVDEGLVLHIPNSYVTKCVEFHLRFEKCKCETLTLGAMYVQYSRNFWVMVNMGMSGYWCTGQCIGCSRGHISRCIRGFRYSIKMGGTLCILCPISGL